MTNDIERGLVEQAQAAEKDWHECVRVRQALRAEAVRTADLYREQAQEDRVAKYQRMFSISAGAAVVGLKRSAAGCRWLIGEWERLEAALAADGTWYGGDQMRAILFQGES